MYPGGGFSGFSKSLVDDFPDLLFIVMFLMESALPIITEI
jgi:hypothetical protein